jgi:hypothetical protein
VRQACLLFGLLLAFAAVGVSQITTGTILGTVTDSSGATISGVKVSVKNIDTNLERSSTTDQFGNYTLSNLPPGVYQLTASAKAFQTQVYQRLELQIQQTARLNIGLQVGSITETVSITAAAPLVDTDNSAQGQVINNKFISELPLNGRNFNSLAILAPNVSAGVNGGPLQKILGDNIGVWANGQRDTNNEWNLDGASMNIGFYNWGAFIPPIEAIEEFKMQTGMYSAEFGFQAGANVNIMVKSGANRVHGSLFEFVRNDIGDARNYFSETRATLKQNQYGGTFGGPVYLPGIYNGKNRTFFFFAYNGTKQRTQSSAQMIFPTDEWKNGNFSTYSNGSEMTTLIDPLSGDPFPGKQIPLTRFSTVAKNIMKYWPEPNRPGMLYNAYKMAAVKHDDNSYIVKLDHRFTDSDSMFFRYAEDHRNRPEPEYIATFYRKVTIDANNGVLSETHIFSPTTLNDFKISFNHSYLADTGTRDGSDFSVAKDLGLTAVTASGRTAGFPYIYLQGVSAIGDNTSDPMLQPDDVGQVTDNITMFRGKHNLKAGIDVRHKRSDRWQGIDVRGVFNFVHWNEAGTGFSFADLALGLPQYSAISASVSQIRMRNNNIAGYFLDDYKVTPNLTLNLGVRYELQTVISDTRGTVTNFNFNTWKPIPLAAGDAFYSPDHNNFAPRFGLAWRPFGGNKTVIRAGYGVFYNANLGLALIRLASNAPYATISESYSSVESPINLDTNPFPSMGTVSTSSTPTYSGISPDYRAAVVQARSVNIQHQFNKDTSIEVGYFGNFCYGLDRLSQPNNATPGAGTVQLRRPHPEYGTVNEVLSDAKSFYNSGTIKVERRVASGLSMLSSYTFSRNIDNSFSSISSQPNDADLPQNSQNLAAERGLSAAHRKHRWVTSATYNLPFGRGQKFLNRGGIVGGIVGGWQLSSLATLQSGPVFGITMSGDYANQGGGITRPNRVCDGNLSRATRSIYHWFDTDCIQSPAKYSYGSAGRAFLIGPGMVNLDSSLGKEFSLKERARVQVRLESFNVLNHTNFGQPGTTVGSNTFGRINSAYDPRLMQAAMKLLF